MNNILIEAIEKDFIVTFDYKKKYTITIVNKKNLKKVDFLFNNRNEFNEITIWNVIYAAINNIFNIKAFISYNIMQKKKIDILFNKLDFDNAEKELLKLKEQLNGSRPQWIKDLENKIEFLNIK